jgi:serine/threonine protein kinase
MQTEFERKHSELIHNIPLSYSHYGSSMKDFKILKDLGGGSYGKVFKVISLQNTHVYVLKQIGIKLLNEKQ